MSNNTECPKRFVGPNLLMLYVEQLLVKAAAEEVFNQSCSFFNRLFSDSKIQRVPEAHFRITEITATVDLHYWDDSKYTTAVDGSRRIDNLRGHGRCSSTWCCTNDQGGLFMNRLATEIFNSYFCFSLFGPVHLILSVFANLVSSPFESSQLTFMLF